MCILYFGTMWLSYTRQIGLYCIEIVPWWWFDRDYGGGREVNDVTDVKFAYLYVFDSECVVCSYGFRVLQQTNQKVNRKPRERNREQ